jgi:hypothetical protein
MKATTNSSDAPRTQLHWTMSARQILATTPELRRFDVDRLANLRHCVGRATQQACGRVTTALPSAAPWRNLSWALFLPRVFAANIVLATLAWIIVGAVMR